jgi:hypothetical protein
MSMSISPKRAAALLNELRDESAYAVYADGTRLRLGRARIVAHRRGRETWVEWGGVKVKATGTIGAIELGQISVGLPSQDVFEGMTFSASVPLTEVLRARTSTR